MMHVPPTSLFASACRIFVDFAYPAGNLPTNKRSFVQLQPQDSLEPLLSPPICERVVGSGGDTPETHGYAFRLGSSHFPHVKLQAVWHEGLANWLFAVDTHDAIYLPSNDPDQERYRELRVKNRQLKEQIEKEWEKAGLLTFNASLRKALDAQA